MPKTKTGAANIHAVVGSDEAEVKRVAADLAKKLAPSDAGDFGLETIDGSADNAEQAAARIRSTIEALQTLPFFGGGKLVWLKNANFLADSQIGRAAGVQLALEELAEIMRSDFGAGTVLLISAIDVDKRRSFYKTLVKRAELQVFDRLDSSRGGWEEEATEIVRARVAKRQLQFDDDALDLFVLFTGGDTRQIENELEKLEIACSTGFQPVGRAGVSPAQTEAGSPRRLGPATGKMPAIPTASSQDESVRLADMMAMPRITVDLVRELVPLSRAGVIFELSNALAARDLQLALTVVRRLLDQGESAIGILLAAIVPTVRNLLLAKDLLERHRLAPPRGSGGPFHFISTLNRLPESATKHLPRKKDGSINAYALGMAAQNAHLFETERLVAGMQACLDANLRLVTTQLNHELVLTEVVVKLIGAE
jgi:DNA polymerase-3 subunit delta